MAASLHFLRVSIVKFSFKVHSVTRTKMAALSRQMTALTKKDES